MSDQPPPTRARESSNDEPVEPERPPDVRGIFEIWVDSALKVQVLVFFHQNPGVIETLDGLAVRLGLSPQALRHELADHIRLGIIKERSLGDKKILVFNRTVERDVAKLVQREIDRRMGNEAVEGSS